MYRRFNVRWSWHFRIVFFFFLVYFNFNHELTRLKIRNSRIIPNEYWNKSFMSICSISFFRYNLAWIKQIQPVRRIVTDCDLDLKAPNEFYVHRPVAMIFHGGTSYKKVDHRRYCEWAKRPSPSALARVSPSHGRYFWQKWMAHFTLSRINLFGLS